MSEIRVRENESLESALRRFEQAVRAFWRCAEVRKREHYEKPSVGARRRPRRPASASTDSQNRPIDCR